MPIIGTTRDTHYAQGALPPGLGDNAINGTHCQRFSTKYCNRKWNRLAICESDYLTHYVQHGRSCKWKEPFPSNISGLPTWYVLRVSDHGYQAPGDRTHIQVLMNKATWEDDIENCLPGTLIIYNQDVKMPVERDDCTVIGAPMTKLRVDSTPNWVE